MRVWRTATRAQDSAIQRFRAIRTALDRFGEIASMRARSKKRKRSGRSDINQALQWEQVAARRSVERFKYR